MADDLSSAMSKLSFTKTGIPFAKDEFCKDDAERKAGKSQTFTLALPKEYDTFLEGIKTALGEDDSNALKFYEGKLKEAAAGKDVVLMMARTLALCTCLLDAGLDGDWSEDPKKARAYVKKVAKHLGSKVLKNESKLGLDADALVALYEILDNIKNRFTSLEFDATFEYEPKSRQSSTASNN